MQNLGQQRGVWNENQYFFFEIQKNANLKKWFENKVEYFIDEVSSTYNNIYVSKIITFTEITSFNCQFY